MDSRAWLTDYKSLPEGSVPAYAQRYGDDDHVLNCYHVIEKALSNVDLAGSIVVQLKSFMQSTYRNLHKFTINVCPLLINEYLRRIRAADNDYGDLEGLLILIAMCDLFSQKRDLTKRPLPQLQQNSVYHDAFLQGDIMTEKSTYSEPIDESLTSINGANRMDLVTRLLNLIAQLDHSEQLHNAILSSLSILLSCPLINEKVVIQVATCAFRQQTPKSIKVLSSCYDHACTNLYLDGLLIINAMRQNITIETGQTNLSIERKTVEEKSLRRAVTSKSIRHHEWKEGGEEEEASEEKVESDKLVAIVEMDEKKQKSTQVAAPMKNGDVQATENEPLLVKG